MRYSVEHKSQSRSRIVEAARRRFRKEGLDGPSIDHVMKDAGLTRGAFYAHFPSREALVAEVLAIEPGLVADVGAASSRTELGDILDAYLSPEQRADVAENCLFVAHPVDVARAGGARQVAFADQVQALLAGLSAHGVSRDSALEIAILTIGGALLSIALPDSETADDVEAVARAAVHRRLAPDG